MREERSALGTDRAKRLRRDMTPPERAMWHLLRAHRLAGWKFTRQVPLGPYVIDFAARRERLAIELDGESHATTQEYDAHRTNYLETLGWTVIRFTNAEIASNPEGVAMTILAHLHAIAPSPRRGEGLKPQDQEAHA